MFGDSDDPRLDSSYVRRIEGDEGRRSAGGRAAPGDGVGDVLIVGVVHDHPASRYRVERAIEAFDPDCLALEVAPLALPLFEGRAREGATPCEMTAAVAAAPADARVAGVDGLDGQFFRTLLGNLRAEDPDPATVTTVVRSVAAVSRHAAACRVAALADRYTPFRLDVEDPVEHDCAPTDPPDAQATDERRQVACSFALLRASSPPTPVAVRDDTREACMLDRIDRLRREGDVAVVVGLDHQDVLADGLTDL